MSIKHNVILTIFVFTWVGVLPSVNATSWRRFLYEKVDESDLIAVGVVTDVRAMYGVYNDTRIPHVYKIRVEEVVKGNVGLTEIVTMEEYPTSESAFYVPGERILMFLKKSAIDPEWQNKVKSVVGDEADLLRRRDYYEFVTGKSGCYRLGADKTIVDKYYALDEKKEFNSFSTEEFKARMRKAAEDRRQEILTINPKRRAKIEESQKYLRSTKEIVRISGIKDENERKAAWEKAVNSNDPVVKESARAKKAREQFIKETEERMKHTRVTEVKGE